MTMDKYETLNEVWAIGSASWPMWRNDSENSGAGQSGPTQLNLRWKFTTGAGVSSTPVIVDGRVYTGSQDKNIYCNDARDGRHLWTFRTGARIKSSVAVANGKVYVGPDDGNVYCLDAKNGSVLWTTEAGGYIEAPFRAVTRIRSSPIVVNGKVYVGSLDNNLYCLDADSGDIVWQFETDGYITSSPAVSDGVVYVTSREPGSGSLYKINAASGNQIWKCDIPYVLVADRGTDLQVSPTVAEGIVCVAANKQNYYGVNASTGEIEWTYVTTEGTEGIGGYLIASAGYHDGQLFIVDMFFITSLNASNGEVLWQSWIGTELYTSPTYADGKVYATTDRRFVYILNATNGDRLSFFETGSNTWSAPSVYGGRVYLGCNDGNIYCLDDYPVTTGEILTGMETSEVEVNETLTVCGQLSPAIPYAPVTITFTKPNGTLVTTEVTAQRDGAFSFYYMSDVIGEVKVSLRCSGATFIMQDAEFSFNVTEATQEPDQNPDQNQDQPQDSEDTGIPIEYIIAAAVVVGAALIAFVAYMVIKKKDTSSPIAISG
jgi:outer membrane protein assembly factor BamB